jgi:transcriptional regulator with XRE-family HTH domain
MLAKTPDPLDVMVGAKIRIFRTHRGMSQSDLAAKIGVAFQQVQKYEKGINRVGASRLSRIAAVLDISIGDLFEPSGNKRSDAKSPFRLLAERDALRVLTAFSRTRDPRVRRAIALLVETIADLRPAARSAAARPAAVKRFVPRRSKAGT